VLFAAAWQTLWLSIAASRVYARMRVERDLAWQAEAQAQELARRDALTGLPNRRGFIDRVETILDHMRNADETVAMLLIDVDWFKSINDVYGHDAGDVVLQGIARCLAPEESSVCAVARLGGEEFAMLVAGMENVALMRFAELLRGRIGSYDHGAVIASRAVTASIGIARAEKAADFHSLYRAADEALYEAKRCGRNRVAIQLLHAPETSDNVRRPVALES
jgi:diguanylate cyclase (GGDEF)-like protein